MSTFTGVFAISRKMGRLCERALKEYGALTTKELALGV